MTTPREQKDVLATSYVGAASYVVLIYDHLLTFSDEVNYIWKGGKGLVIYLFFLNRYLFPFAFAVNLYAYQSREFNPEVCKHFVRYEGATAVIAFGVTGLMMILRVNALYGGRSRVVQAILGALWLGQVGIYAWLLSTSMPVPHSAGISSCSLLYDPRSMNLASLSASAPLVFDTAVIILTVYRALSMPRKCGTTSGSRWFSGIVKNNTLFRTLVMDGALYYIVVFSTNLSLMIMILTAPDGLKNILAQFSQLITVTMVSRITLHLRKVGAKRSSTVIVSSDSSAPLAAYSFNSKGNGTSSVLTSRYSRVEFAAPRLPEIRRLEGLSLDWGSGGGNHEHREHNSETSSSSSGPRPSLTERRSLLKSRRSFVQ